MTAIPAPLSPAFDFSDRCVFVAGGTSGINLGVAQRFAAAGATVGVMSRSQDKVDAAVKELGDRAMGWAADVREYEAVAEAINAFVEKAGAMHAVVSGAAGNFVAPAEGISTNGWKAVTEIDTLGTFHVFKASFEHLKATRGAAIAISAPQAFQPMPFQAHVCAAKAGVDAMVKTLAIEWGPHGVRVNSISPGPIADTEGMARLAPGEALEKVVIGTVPLKRLGGAHEVGEAAVWLASDSASYVSGVVLPVDGGWGLAGAASVTDKIVEHFEAEKAKASG